METTSQAATSFSDVGDHHVEMLLDVSSEVQEMKSADASAATTSSHAVPSYTAATTISSNAFSV